MSERSSVGSYSLWSFICADGLIYFNTISICLGLFYAKRLRSRVHCMFIPTFLVPLFLKMFFLLAVQSNTVIFWPSTRPKNAIPRWCTGRKWHIPMANNRKKSRRCARLIIWDKVKVPLQSDAPEESDLWTAWQLFPLDDDHTGHSKDSGSDTSRSPDIGRNYGGVEACPYLCVGVWR